ncbi:MAG TPA: trigger factor [Pseudomonadales bacterium]
MQVSIETTSGLERRMTIVVPSETFEQQISDRLKATAQRARLAGFRPGKVPVKEIRRRFGKSVRQEVAGELMQSTFFDAIQRESMAPAGSPSLDVLRMEPGEDFEFAATFEVYPPVDLAPLNRVTVKRPNAEISDADVTKMIDSLREQRKHWHAVERAAADGDRVTIDFKGTIDGVAFDGGAGQDVAFVLGAKQMIDDFDNGVRGASTGNAISFDATFPIDYRVETLAGKTARFDVTIKEVAHAHLPDLDDAFFKTFGLDSGGIDAFRVEVRNNMERELAAAVKNQLKRQVMDELKRLHEVQLPMAMVKREIGALQQQMAQQMQSYTRAASHGHDDDHGDHDPDHGHDHDHDHDGHDHDHDGHDHDHDHAAKLPDLPDELFRAEAERRVKVGLVVNELINVHGLKSDPVKVRERIEEIAKTYVQPEQVINWYYSNQNQLSQIEMAVLEDQVVEHILENADVSEVHSNYEDILAGRAVPQPDADANAVTSGEDK